jgi:hypothetical protein
VADLDLLNPSPLLLEAVVPLPVVSNEKKKRRSYGWREYQEPALCPSVAGDFVPFVYLSGLHGQTGNSLCLDESEEALGSDDDIVAAYCFRTVRSPPIRLR